MTTHEALIVAQGPRPGTIKKPDGSVATIPAGWGLLEPGDATLTRRVKAAGPSWTVQSKKGRKVFSHGVWAPQEHIDAERAKIDAERADPAYAKRLDGDRARRAKKQEAYVEDFYQAVLDFLNFHARYEALGQLMAKAISDHATPVGSGTVARTERIPIEERAQSATIAWMRHQTTAYDRMSIPRVKGMRRQVRRQLAQRSRELLTAYRSGADRDPLSCPLYKALNQLEPAQPPSPAPKSQAAPSPRATAATPAPAPAPTAPKPPAVDASAPAASASQPKPAPRAAASRSSASSSRRASSSRQGSLPLGDTPVSKAAAAAAAARAARAAAKAAAAKPASAASRGEGGDGLGEP